MPVKNKKQSAKIGRKFVPGWAGKPRLLAFVLLFAVVGGFLVYRSLAATNDDLVAKGFSTYNSAVAKTIKMHPNQRGGYFLDGYGGLQPFQLGDSQPLPLPKGTATWQNPNTARDFVITNWNKPAGYTMDLYGGLHPFGGAGKANGGPYFAGHDIARRVVLTKAKTNGFVLDGYGGLHGFGVGANPAPTNLRATGYWAGQDIARSVVISPSADKGYVLDAYCGLHPFSFNGAALPPAVTNNTGYIQQDVCRGVVVTNWNKPAGYVVRSNGGMYPFGGATAGAGQANFKPAEGLADAANLNGSASWVLGRKGTIYSFSTANQPLQDTPTASKKNAERMGFNFGGNAFMQVPKEEYFNYVALSGIKNVFFEVTQGSVHKALNTFDFSDLDGTMAQVRRVNVKAVMGLNAAAPWDNPIGRRPSNFDHWAKFAGAVAGRYKDVTTFSIWNEPNLGGWWGGDQPSATEYTQLLCKASAAIKKANPKAQILAGNFAPGGDYPNLKMAAPHTFLAGIYANGGRDCFDMVGHHPYQWDVPVTEPWAFQDTNKIRQVMVTNGDAGKKVWASEVGAPTDHWAPEKVLTEAKQAATVPAYLNAWWYQSWGKQGFTGPWFQYKLFESGTEGDDPGFGLIKTNTQRTQKPIFKVYVDYGQRAQ